MPARPVLTPEDEELEEADCILAELRRKAGTGEGELAWGECSSRTWGADGVLRVQREYTLPLPGAPTLLIRESPYSAHPCSGLGGTGGVVWPGALVLVELLCERHLELLEGTRSLLEIGAGCGLAGLGAAALLSALPASAEPPRVILTDCAEPVIENLRSNVSSNAASLVGVSVEVARLAWEELLSGEAAAPVEAVDMLVGSDVIWGDRGPLVGRVARRLVRPDGRLLIVAQEGREGLADFLAELRGDSGADGGAGEPFEVEVVRRELGGDAFLCYLGRRPR